ncbi:MAG TPA: hypothetical protein VNI61_10520 [Gemmatimonadales bacterium]|nr:hypothetical protein [Gemmatimonadales bacterium]
MAQRSAWGLLSVPLAGLLLSVAQPPGLSAPRQGPGSTAPRPGPAATILFQDGFEGGDLHRWEQRPPARRYRISTDPSRVKSGRHSLEALYAPNNTYGMLTRWFMPGVEEVYVKFDVMFEEGFVNPGMHFFVVAGNRTDDPWSAAGKAGVKPDGRDFFYAGLDPEYHPQDSGLGPLHFYTYWPDMVCCYGNRFYQSSPKTPLLAGRWYEIVFHIKLNTPGQSNGSQTLWVDGVRTIEVHSLRWRSTAALRLNQIRFDNWMAAGPRAQRLWVDDVMVWRP